MTQDKDDLIVELTAVNRALTDRVTTLESQLKDLKAALEHEKAQTSALKARLRDVSDGKLHTGVVNIKK